MKLTTNFNLSEFNSKCGRPMPENVRVNIQRLANALQVIRDEVKKPITITSGYRSPEHNRAVKGASNSFHLTGIACDFKVSGMTPKQVATTIEKLIEQGKIPQGGLKAYSSWIHYDIRGTKARW
jgi:uncharacterized protein YcbK (DUF882 family)